MLMIFKTQVLIINCSCYDFEPFSVPKISSWGFFLNPKRQHWLWISKCASILTYCILIANTVDINNIGEKLAYTKLNMKHSLRSWMTQFWTVICTQQFEVLQPIRSRKCKCRYPVSCCFSINQLEISWKSPLTLSYSSESSLALLAVFRHH